MKVTQQEAEKILILDLQLARKRKRARRWGLEKKGRPINPKEYLEKLIKELQELGTTDTELGLCTGARLLVILLAREKLCILSLVSKKENDLNPYLSALIGNN